MEERRAVERLKRGEPAGLETFVKAHQVRAVRAAYLICRDRALAEDVVQGAFVKAYEKIKGFDGRRSLPRARPSVVFEARVREVEVLEVNETAESNGLPMTLTGIVDSPVSTSANLCFEPEDGNDQPVVSWRRPDGSSTKPNSWTILPKGESLYVSGVFRQGQMFGQGAANKAGCATVKWSGTLSDEPGVHSLTVTRLEPSFMNSRGPEAGPPKEGSWKFSFEVPER